jgi:genome maintenance exonuclease 1
MRIFEKCKIDRLSFDMKTRYEKGRRIYLTPEGNSYPSVTSVLSTMNKDFLIKWRERIGDVEADKIVRMASSRGNRLHDACEKYLQNQLSSFILSSMMPDAKQLFLSLKPEFEKSIGKVYCLEQPLYSDRLKVAGRVDCVAEWDGILSIVDFKNSLRPKLEEYIQNYFMQCTSYACMFSELTNIPVKQIVVAVGVVDDPKPQIFIRKVSDYVEDTIKFIKNYHLTN